LRFEDGPIREASRSRRNPFAAKLLAKANADRMTVTPCSEQNLANMEVVLRLKLEQHPGLHAAPPARTPDLTVCRRWRAQLLSDAPSPAVVNPVRKRPGATAFGSLTRRSQTAALHGGSPRVIMASTYRKVHSWSAIGTPLATITTATALTSYPAAAGSIRTGSEGKP
jgi:hypothetical protein